MAKVPLLSKHNDRLSKWFERQDGKDFPFYNGKPVGLTTWQWLAVWLSAAVGFAALVLTPQHNNFEAFIPRVLFVAIPLVVLAYFTKGYWKALFQKPTKADYKVMVGYFLLNVAVSLIVAQIVKLFTHTNANPVGEIIAAANPAELVMFYIGTGIQLMGEEIFTILPFLAIMYFFYKNGKVSRKSAIIWTWVLTALWFGAAHLPTYGWNFIQCFVIIGSARLVLSLAYIRTKNVWASYGAHLLNDWTLFTFILLLSKI